MSDFVLVSGGLVDEEELEVLVQTIANMKHADAEVEKQFKVVSDSPALLAAVSALFAESAPVVVQVEVKKRGKYKKAQNKELQGVKPAPTRGPHVRSIELLATGEKISRFELNKRLAERTIEPGVTLRSPKYGVITVATSGDSLVVMDADERVV